MFGVYFFVAELMGDFRLILLPSWLIFFSLFFKNFYFFVELHYFGGVIFFFSDKATLFRVFLGKVC